MSGAFEMKKGKKRLCITGDRNPMKNPITVEKVRKTIRNQYKNGRKVWNKGLTKETDERVLKQSLKMVGHQSSFKNKTYEEIYGVEEAKRKREILKKRRCWNRGLTKETNEGVRKISENLKGRSHKPETIDKIRKSMIGKLKGRSTRRKGKTYKEIYGEKAGDEVRKRVKSLFKRPTSYEQKIIWLIEQYDLPFKYIGDGRQIIGHVNPDFIDTLKLNPPLIIEVYHDYFHQGNYELVRYKQLQIPKENVLFLKDEDLLRKDWEVHCLRKIKEFMS
jgi:hypothetical protein